MDGITPTIYTDRKAALEAWKALPDSQLHVVTPSADAPGTWVLQPRDEDQVNRHATNDFADQQISFALNDLDLIEGLKSDMQKKLDAMQARGDKSVQKIEDFGEYALVAMSEPEIDRALAELDGTKEIAPK